MTFSEVEANVCFWTERDRGGVFKLFVLLSLDSVLLQDGREDQDGLHLGKVVADANPLSTAKGHIGMARQLLFQSIKPTRGIKLKWTIKPPFVSVHVPGRQDHLRAFGHVPWADLNIFNRLTTHRPSRGIQSQALFDERVEQGQLSNVCYVWRI